MVTEDELRSKLFGKKNETEEIQINICPGCGNQFKRFLGTNCTMTCYYECENALL